VTKTAVVQIYETNNKFNGLADEIRIEFRSVRF